MLIVTKLPNVSAQSRAFISGRSKKYIPIANSDDKWQIIATFANYIKIQLQDAYAVATAKWLSVMIRTFDNTGPIKRR